MLQLWNNAGVKLAWGDWRRATTRFWSALLCITNGDGAAFPHLAASTNALPSEFRGRCVAGMMAQEPTSDHPAPFDLIIGSTLSFLTSHSVEGPIFPPTALHDWSLHPPACAHVARVAGPDRITDSCHCLPPSHLALRLFAASSGLLALLFRVFIHFLSIRTCSVDVVIQHVARASNINEAYINLIAITPTPLGLSGGRCGSANSAQGLLLPVQIPRPSLSPDMI